MRSLLPNALQRSASDHVAVLADEVRELLAVEPGETVVDATFGAGGHARVLAADLRGRGRLIAIDRDPGARGYFERFAPEAGVQARFLRGAFDVGHRTARDERGASGRDPLRPRHLEHADRPARARLLLRGRCSARHADGSLGAPLGARHRQRGRRAGARRRSSRRYGEERFARQIARAIVRRRRRPPVRADGGARRDDPRERSRASPVRGRPPGEAGLPGPAHRRQRRARGARAGASRRARDASTGRAHLP